MANRSSRLIRIYNIMDIMWRHELRYVSTLEIRLSDVSKSEFQTIHHMGDNIPSELAISRLCLLHQQRQYLIDEITKEKAKAKATGLKIKLVEKLIAELEKMLKF